VPAEAQERVPEEAQEWVPAEAGEQTPIRKPGTEDGEEDRQKKIPDAQGQDGRLAVQQIRKFTKRQYLDSADELSSAEFYLP